MSPFIIPVFLPQAGCPHQCVFCDQAAITGVKKNSDPVEELRASMRRFSGFKPKKNRSRQVSFYGGNFLGQRPKTIRALLTEAENYVDAGKIDSIRFSTRPDTIRAETLDILESHSVKTVELGVQSMDDAVLSMSRRGHRSMDTETAAGLLKQRGYEIGAQLMTGLPGDSDEKARLTAEKVATLPFDFARIYPTLLFKGSALATWHIRGDYVPSSLDQTVSLVMDMYLSLTEKNIPVIRMGLQAGEGLELGSQILGGPWHPAFGHLVHSKIFLEKASAAIKSAENISDSLSLKVHPASVSKLIGMKKNNMFQLKKRFHLKSIQILPDPSLGQDDVEAGF